MTEYNRQKQLKSIHELKKSTTFKKVDEAIERLVKSSKPINFNSVAIEAKLSKPTLYKHKEIRKRIESLRAQQLNSPSKSQKNSEIISNNKEVVIESLKRRIKKLEKENKELKEKMKLTYTEIYEKMI